MKKFDLEDWDIEPELDVNRDDFIYGHYVDWDRFRIENEDLFQAIVVCTTHWEVCDSLHLLHPHYGGV